MRRANSPQISGTTFVLLLAALLLSFVPSRSAQAQIGGAIGYGSSVQGSIPTAGQTVIYSFNGSANDFVEVWLHNWTGTLTPHLDLLAPDGQTIATSSRDPFSEDPLAASMSLFLPQSGIYSLSIGGADNTFGQFILRVEGRGALSVLPLVSGQSRDVNIPTNPAPQYFDFESQACVSVLTIANLSAGLPFTFPFHVRVHNERGTEIAQFYGGDALEDRLILEPNSGRYHLTVLSDDPLTSGTIQLLVSCADQAPGCLAAQRAAGLPVDTCPPCPAVGLCASFEITVALDGLSATFTWPPASDAEWYIFSITDALGGLLLDSAQLLEDETSHTYTFAPGDLPRGPFTAYVSAGAEGDAMDTLCLAEVPVSFDGTTTEQCSGITVGAEVVPGARMAVANWSGVSGAAAYLIHVYAYAADGGLIGIRVLTVPGEATTYHLADVFPTAYDRFQINIDAYAEATGGGAFGDMPQGYLCDGSTDITFGPLGPVEWGPAT